MYKQSLSLSRIWRTYDNLLENCCFQRYLINLTHNSQIKMLSTTKSTTTPSKTKALQPVGLSCHQFIQNKNKYDINSNIINDEYEKAIQALNSLQSNAETLRQARKHFPQDIKQTPLTDTISVLERSGLTLNDLDKLSFIHVSGTKGKGSTCALTESILRHCHGIRTGFFSSPHLVSVQERIRINGQPISKEKFTKAFWFVYESLKDTSKDVRDMPAYFKFLTILSFHIFLAEKVDVVILEVGIGGELDCTNIIRNTCTVGISSLGLEHTQLLGTTLPEIAWQKAGIIKKNSHVFTSVTQTECLNVIRERVNEKKAKSFIAVPSLSSYSNSNGVQYNDMVHLNGSLAIQLAYDWLRQNKSLLINNMQITPNVIRAFNDCTWPGRCQSLKLFNFNIYLDGAHTVESMCICRDWFHKVTAKQIYEKLLLFLKILSPKKSKHAQVLIFNSTGDRDSKKLLSVLQSKSKFDLACFVPNITSMTGNIKDNQTVHNHADQCQRAILHANNWVALRPDLDGKVFESVVECFQHLQGLYNDNEMVDILVTGSLHLIGATLLALDELRSKK